LELRSSLAAARISLLCHLLVIVILPPKLLVGVRMLANPFPLSRSFSWG
jgi:hypothetical protein